LCRTKDEILPSLTKIRNWFSEGDDDSDWIIDEEWKLTELNEKTEDFAVSHENLPFDIGIYIKREIVKLIVYTDLKTKKWSVEGQRDIYRDLLIRNNKDLFTKYYLVGENNRVAVRTDINLLSYNKEEFNDALQAVILGTKWLLNKTGALEDKD